MNTTPLPRLAALCLLAAAIALPACGPNYNAVANRLREQNIAQQQQISTLKDKIAARDATIQHLQSANTANPIPTLPPKRLAQLFTVGKVQLQSSTNVSPLDHPDGKPAGFRVFFRTLTDDGTIIPATGNLTLEAFELPPAPAQPLRLGTWHFSPAQMKANWYSGFGLNHFAFNCPWTSPPKQPDLLFRATYTDALTGVTFSTQLNKTISLP